MRGVIRWTVHGKQWFLDGREVTEEEFHAAFHPTAAARESGPSSLVYFKPLHCEALAVHPLDVQEATEDAKRKGVPVEFDQEGRPVFTSSRQYRDYARKYGFRHKSYM